jgi:hypothetical protein
MTVIDRVPTPASDPDRLAFDHANRLRGRPRCQFGDRPCAQLAAPSGRWGGLPSPAMPERDLFANFERMQREMDELLPCHFGFSPAVDVY